MVSSSHIDADGSAHMVDTSGKTTTERSAVAKARIQLNADSARVIRDGQSQKGSVLNAAKIAGILAAKRVSELIPLCHQIPLDHVDCDFELDEQSSVLTITSRVHCVGKTGVEMEALTACSVAALTVYDMVKSVQRDIVIIDVMLIEKKGGRTGEYRRNSL